MQDDISFGLKPGGQLELRSTLCFESRAAREPVVFDHASQDPVYCGHHTPLQYKLESYISVPIVLSNGDYFGNLCAIDPRPAEVSNQRTLTMFTLFAELIALQLESELRHAAAESALSTERATAELREQFIAVLGHDLRNPLSAVGATGELLTRRTDQADLVSMGQRLRNSTRRMSRLIDDVLDFARGRLGGGIGVDPSGVTDLDAALEEVVAEVRGANPGRVVQADIAVHAPVHCDRGRLQQLLSNLLGNAVTYGAPDQPVVVAVAIDGDQLELRVSNRGEPIAAPNLTRVFEPYWRQTTASGRPAGGLGLGLYICSRIVDAHHGTLSVTSSAEHGTTFVARLPVQG